MEWSVFLVAVTMVAMRCENLSENRGVSWKWMNNGYSIRNYRQSHYTMGDIFKGTLLRRENTNRSVTNLPSKKRYSARIPSNIGNFPSLRGNVYVSSTPRMVLGTISRHSVTVSPVSAMPEVIKNGYEGFSYCLKNSMNGTDDEFITCVKTMLVENLRRIVQSDSVKVFGGLMEVKKYQGWNSSDTSQYGNDDVEDAEPLDWEVARGLDNFSKTFALRTEIFPGVNLRLARSIVPNSVNFGIDLEPEDGTSDVDEGRDHEKQKEKKKKKSLLKKYKKLLPLLLIPFAIQALILPWFLASLKMMALKAVLVGKLAILATIFTAFMRARSRTDHDIYTEDIASEHYGYDGGMEFGAWINGRKRRRRRDAVVGTLAYRGHSR